MSSRLAIIVAVVGLVAAGRPASAHPGWGLVRDNSRGIVYYTDLTQVWRIDASGERRVAVPNVHTHELRLDEAGNLHGEDSQGIGGGGWRYRVWRLSPDGRLTDVIPWKAGFRDDYGFVRDGAGALYWASCTDTQRLCTVKRRTPDGRVSVAAGGAEFERPLNFVAPDAAGGVLLADGPDLKRITPTSVSVVAGGLAKSGGRFALMGLHATSDRGVYLAAFEDRVVVRLGADGGREVVARSDGPWQPAGVLVAPEGIWVLEYDRARVQLRCIGTGGRVRVYGPAD